MSEEDQVDPAKIEVDILQLGLLTVTERAGYWLGSEQYKAAIAIAAKLHNAGLIDVFEQLKSAGEETKPKRVENAFWQLISSSNITGQEYLEHSDALIALGKLDVDGFIPEEPFSRWLESDPLRAEAILVAADSDLDRLILNLHLALQNAALSDPKGALSRVKMSSTSQSDQRRRVVLWALAEMVFRDPLDQQEVFDFLRSVVDQGPVLDKAIALNVIAHRSARDLPNASRQLKDALALGKTSLSADAWASVLVDILWRQHAQLSGDALSFLLSELGRQDLEALNRFEHISHALYGVMQSENWQIGVDFLSSLLIAYPSLSIRSFQTLSHALVASDHLGVIVCDWFADGRHPLCSAAVEMLGERAGGDNPVTVPTQWSAALAPEDRVRLSRRGVGYCLHLPITAASLVLAAMRGSTPAESTSLMRLLVNPLLYCYRGKLRSYLQEAVKIDVELKDVIEMALAAQDSFYSGLESAKFLSELAPSETQRVIANDFRREAENEIRESARAASPLLYLFSQSRILFGDATVSYFPKAPGSEDLARSTLQMQTYGYEYEIPRMDCWDPIGVQMQVYLLRTEPDDR